MCSRYWTLTGAPVTCPNCHRSAEWDLQTHYRGEPGSCMHYYPMGEPVAELAGHPNTDVDADSDGFDPLLSECPHCDAWGELAFRVAGGAVTALWPAGDRGAVQ